MNHENSSDRNAQLLAVFLNWELKNFHSIESSGEAQGESQVSKLEQNIEIILSLFRSLNSSDVFEKTYTRQLAARLLSKSGCSKEMEKRMATAFKNECGESFSTLTELMFTSTGDSENLTESFKACATKIPFTDFTFKVLEQKTWPIDSSLNAVEVASGEDANNQEEAKTGGAAKGTTPRQSSSSRGNDHRDSNQSAQTSNKPVTLPKPLSDVFNSFSKFYKEQFRGKRLDYIYQYGNCLI